MATSDLQFSVVVVLVMVFMLEEWLFGSSDSVDMHAQSAPGA